MQKKTVHLVDDLDGSEAHETVTFGLDGQPLEIDLSSANADRLREALAPYVENARRVGGRKAIRKSTPPTLVPAGPKRAKPSAGEAAQQPTTRREKTAPKGATHSANRGNSNRGSGRGGKRGAAKVTFIEPAAADVRSWARSRGMTVASRGKVPDEVVRAFLEHSAPTRRVT